MVAEDKEMLPAEPAAETVGGEFSPVPDAATVIDDAPPPLTTILPLYDCTTVGVNFTYRPGLGHQPLASVLMWKYGPCGVE